MEGYVNVTGLRKDRTLSLKKTRKEIGTRRRLEKKERRGQQIIKEIKRKRSVGGRIGSMFSKARQVGRRGVTRSLYDREQPQQMPVKRIKGMTRTGGVATGRRGRPKGSYDLRYAKWGGVYGYRKAMAQNRRLERIQALRDASVTPRQQQTLRRIEMRNQMEQQRKERNPFHGTSGSVQLGEIMNEINRATNLVD